MNTPQPIFSRFLIRSVIASQRTSPSHPLWTCSIFSSSTTYSDPHKSSNLQPFPDCRLNPYEYSNTTFIVKGHGVKGCGSRFLVTHFCGSKDRFSGIFHFDPVSYGTLLWYRACRLWARFVKYCGAKKRAYSDQHLIS